MKRYNSRRVDLVKRLIFRLNAKMKKRMELLVNFFLFFTRNIDLFDYFFLVSNYLEKLSHPMIACDDAKAIRSL